MIEKSIHSSISRLPFGGRPKRRSRFGWGFSLLRQYPRPKFSSKISTSSQGGGWAALALLSALSSHAFAQQENENPIPPSGGALIMPKDALPDPLAAGWNDEKVCVVLEESDKFRALKCSFAPGVGHERHFHAPHFGYVLEGGKMRITDKAGTREQAVPTGATWKSDGVEWHEALNIGETTAVYIIVEPKGPKN